jgi:hypothetical protein
LQRERTVLEMKLLRGRELYRKGKTQKAIGVFREIRKAIEHSFYKDSLDDIADKARRGAIRAMAAGEPEADIALPSVDTGPAAPSRSRAVASHQLLRYARGYLHEGDHERAGVYARAAAQLDPTNDDARALIGVVDSGRRIEALERLLPEGDPRTAASRTDIVRRREVDALAKPVTADFDRVPLKDALEYIETYADIDIVVDAQDLLAAGASLNTPVTLKVANEPVVRVMDRLAERIGLRSQFRRGVFELASAGKAAARRGGEATPGDPIARIDAPADGEAAPGGEPELRVYDIADLLPPEPPRDDMLEHLPPIPLAQGFLDPAGFSGVIVSGTHELWLPNVPTYYGGANYGFGLWPGYSWYGGYGGGFGVYPVGPLTPFPEHTYSIGGGYGGVYRFSRYGGYPGFVHPGHAGFGRPPGAGSTWPAEPIWRLGVLPFNTLGGPLPMGARGVGGAYKWVGRGEMIFDLDREAQRREEARRRRPAPDDPYLGVYTEEQLLKILRRALEED